MLRRLVIAETRRMLRDRPFRWALVVILMALALTVWSGQRRVERDRRMAAEVLSGEAARYDKLADGLRTGTYPKGTWGNLSSAGTVGLTVGARAAILPVRPLAVLAVGARDVMPTAVGITTRLDPLAERYERIISPMEAAVGPLDFSFVIVILLPLLIFALAYDLVSGDRERGTLLLIISQPTPYGAVLFTRVAVRLVAFLVVAALVVSSAVLASGAQSSGAAIFSQAALTLAVVCAYGAFWFALTLAVQRLQRSSQTNALICLGAWLIWVVIVPVVLETVIDLAVPVPSRVELFEATRRAQRDATRKEDQALAAYYGDHPQLSPGTDEASTFWTHWVARTRETEKALTPLNNLFADRIEARQRLVESLSWLSPAVAASEAILVVAGSDARRHNAFLRQVRQFSKTYRQFFEDRVLANRALTAADVAATPRFEFAEEAAPITRARIVRHLVEIFVATVAFLWLAFFGIRRARWILEAHDG